LRRDDRGNLGQYIERDVTPDAMARCRFEDRRFTLFTYRSELAWTPAGKHATCHRPLHRGRIAREPDTGSPRGAGIDERDRS
jgi:hypothetical protein